MLKTDSLDFQNLKKKKTKTFKFASNQEDSLPIIYVCMYVLNCLKVWVYKNMNLTRKVKYHNFTISSKNG